MRGKAWELIITQREKSRGGSSKDMVVTSSRQHITPHKEENTKRGIDKVMDRNRIRTLLPPLDWKTTTLSPLQSQYATIICVDTATSFCITNNKQPQQIALSLFFFFWLLLACFPFSIDMFLRGHNRCPMICRFRGRPLSTTVNFTVCSASSLCETCAPDEMAINNSLGRASAAAQPPPT